MLSIPNVVYSEGKVACGARIMSMSGRHYPEYFPAHKNPMDRLELTGDNPAQSKARNMIHVATLKDFTHRVHSITSTKLPAECTTTKVNCRH